jgi:hypothetical protein
MAHAEEAHRLCERPLLLVSESQLLAALGGDRGGQLYPMTDKTFPIGMAMNRNLTIKAGNHNPCKSIPKLVGKGRAGLIDSALETSDAESGQHIDQATS